MKRFVQKRNYFKIVYFIYLTKPNNLIMKSLLIVAVAVFALSACKKDYTCECTVDYMGITTSASQTIHDSKKKAKDACKALSTTGATCEIK